MTKDPVYDFFVNASDEERAETYDKVLKKVDEDQQAILDKANGHDINSGLNEI